MNNFNKSQKDPIIIDIQLNHSDQSAVTHMLYWNLQLYVPIASYLKKDNDYVYSMANQLKSIQTSLILRPQYIYIDHLNGIIQFLMGLQNYLTSDMLMPSDYKSIRDLYDALTPNVLSQHYPNYYKQIHNCFDKLNTALDYHINLDIDRQYESILDQKTYISSLAVKYSIQAHRLITALGLKNLKSRQAVLKTKHTIRRAKHVGGAFNYFI